MEWVKTGSNFSQTFSFSSVPSRMCWSDMLGFWQDWPPVCWPPCKILTPSKKSSDFKYEAQECVFEAGRAKWQGTDRNSTLETRTVQHLVHLHSKYRYIIKLEWHLFHCSLLYQSIFSSAITNEYHFWRLFPSPYRTCFECTLILIPCHFALPAWKIKVRRFFGGGQYFTGGSADLVGTRYVVVAVVRISGLRAAFRGRSGGFMMRHCRNMCQLKKLLLTTISVQVFTPGNYILGRRGKWSVHLACIPLSAITAVSVLPWN